jgi:hypothetical protein
LENHAGKSQIAEQSALFQLWGVIFVSKSVMSNMDAGTRPNYRLSDFPEEVLRKICAILPDLDVLRLGCTCKRLESLLVRDDSLWKDRCHARWMLPASNANGVPNATTWRHLSFEGNGWAVKRLMASSLSVPCRWMSSDFSDPYHYMRFEYSPDSGMCHMGSTSDVFVDHVNGTKSLAQLLQRTSLHFTAGQ